MGFEAAVSALKAEAATGLEGGDKEEVDPLEMLPPAPPPDFEDETAEALPAKARPPLAVDLRARFFFFVAFSRCLAALLRAASSTRILSCSPNCLICSWSCNNRLVKSSCLSSSSGDIS